MIEAITKSRWLDAQQAERAQHTFEPDLGKDHYERSYAHVFDYLGMEWDQHGKSIIEVGPADFPALAYCSNYKGTIIEPMVSGLLNITCNNLGIWLIARPLEEIEFASAKSEECWIFNCLQHVIDPERFIAKAKSIAKRVRFFEPIDYETSPHHPHTFTIENFQRWFGHAERYVGGSVEGFHTADCAYGTYECV